VEWAVRISIRLQRVTDWALWRILPPPKQNEMSKAQPLEKKKWQYACRLFRTKSLKEGAMWHVDPLSGNDRKTSNYTTTTAK
jgi:hypothetical protein